VCWLLGTSVWKTGEFLGEDQHCVKKSEWTVLNFSLSQAARKSDEERRQRFFLKSLFSERMTQVASTAGMCIKHPIASLYHKCERYQSDFLVDKVINATYTITSAVILNGEFTRECPRY
jgi:hypothetical protein